MKVKVGEIPCKDCEGVGCKINMFDPPKRDIPGTGGRRTMVKSIVRRSSSGREILNENCEKCHGTGKRLGFIRDEIIIIYGHVSSMY